MAQKCSLSTPFTTCQTWTLKPFPMWMVTFVICITCSAFLLFIWGVSLHSWIVTLRCFSKIAWIFLKMRRRLSNKPSSDLQVIEKKLYHPLAPCSFSPSYAWRMWCTCSLSRNTMSQGSGRIWTKRQELVHWFILAYLLLLALPCTCFLPNFWSQVLTLPWKSHTHQYITERSIVNVTLESLRATKQPAAVEKVSCAELYTLKIGKEELLFYYYVA